MIFSGLGCTSDLPSSPPNRAGVYIAIVATVFLSIAGLIVFVLVILRRSRRGEKLRVW